MQPLHLTATFAESTRLVLICQWNSLKDILAFANLSFVSRAFGDHQDRAFTDRSFRLDPDAVVLLIVEMKNLLAAEYGPSEPTSEKLWFCGSSS